MASQSNKTNKQHNGNGDGSQVHLNNRKRRLKWTIGLHECFLKAVHQLGGPYKATPKQIQKLMNVQEVNSDHIKSHLQKHRLRIDQSWRVETKAASKGPFSAPAIWIPEGNEDTYVISTLIARHTNEDIQSIKAQRPTFEGPTKFNVKSKNSDIVKQQQLQFIAHKTYQLRRSDAEAKYDNGQLASNYEMQIPDTNFIISLAETKEKHMSLYSSFRDANADKTTAEQKMSDDLTISSGSIFSKGGPKTRVEDHIDVPRMTASRCHLPFDLNVSAQDE